MRTTKICSKCKREKPRSEFSPRKDRPSGLYSCCKTCKALSKADQYRKRRQDDPVSLWVVNAANWARDRARRKGIPCDIQQGDLRAALEQQGFCCRYCSRTLNFRRTIATRADSPTVDRVIPGRGYDSSNIVISCYRCNAIKNDATADELQTIAAAVRQLVQERRL